MLQAIRSLVFLTLVLASLLSAQEIRADEEPESDYLPLVNVSEGALAGTLNRQVKVFRGVPYAQAPVGELRWKAPEDPLPWEGIRQADTFGPACPQQFNILFADAGRQSEDCLYLNVWTPDHMTSGLPVLVYIHGGAFRYGSASQLVYDGTALAEKGMVVVTINYRLGLLGFLAHPELSAENETGSSGNYALLDQLKALQWVQRNIASFGGDPGNVTLMGESAGSVSVCALLSSPLSGGLFHRAIAMSGGAPDRIRDIRRERRGLASMEQIGSEWAAGVLKRHELDSFSDLRELPWQDLQGTHSAARLGTATDIVSLMSMADSICIDGYVLTDSPAGMFENGLQMPVPLLSGSLVNEGGMFTLGLEFSSMEQYESLLEEIFSADIDTARDLYPAANEKEALRQLTGFISDGFASGARSAVRDMSRINPDCWLYRFDYESPAARLSGLGSFHGSELPYFFGSYPLPVAYGRGSQLLSDRIGTYLLNFISTGNPNAAGYTEWPRYDPDDEKLMLIDLPMSASGIERLAQLELIRKNGLW